jgi:peptide/nickel transport system ATP-binding protein
MQIVLTARGLRKTFRSDGRTVAALAGVDLDLAAGETLGVVGMSGSGKSTLARALLRLVETDAGAVSVCGRDFGALSGAALRAARRDIQIVFQDPSAAFNPRATVAGALADPLRVHALAAPAEMPRAIASLLDRVGLAASLAERAVRDLSGGQRQRVAIARALATRPRIVVLDEPVSALDVSIRGQILNLLDDLRRADGLAYVFVSHDMGAVNAFADRIAVMDAGRFVETGAARDVIAAPSSSAARMLVDAVRRLPVQRLASGTPT